MLKIKETTYNKYKRERNELKQLVDIDIQRFAISQRDFADRLAFIKKMIWVYRKEQQDKCVNDLKSEVKE